MCMFALYTEMEVYFITYYHAVLCPEMEVCFTVQYHAVLCSETEVCFTMQYHAVLLYQGTIRYRLAGEGLGLFYFKIDETTGRISVARNLRTGRDMTYTVSASP